MKTQKQENFPVASILFGRKYRKIITNYYNFARYCDDIADNPELSEVKKLELLDIAEKSLYGNANLECSLLLRKNFLDEKLDFSLATDLLCAFRQDAKSIKYETWAQLLDYCKYSASPVGRFMLALYDENPSTYIPATALCSVLQIVNHVQDLRDDVRNLKRIYIPCELLVSFKVSEKALKSSKCSKNLHFLINEILNRCNALLDDASILPAITKNIRLKVYICITLCLTYRLIAKLKKYDILESKVKLSKCDWLIASFNGLIKAITTKKKTLTNKGL